MAIELQVKNEAWPELKWETWQDTLATLHLWTQVVGKIRMKLAPKSNHWWHVTLYPTCRGLTTSPMPYGNRTVQIDFDFLSHRLLFETSDGHQESIALIPMSVAAFYAQVMAMMHKLEMPVTINPMPSEIANAVSFEKDEHHAAYDAESVTRFWNVMRQTDRVFTEFRGRFIGKSSPVHFFWGGFDLALTRFSGHKAPIHASVPDIPDHVVQSAYSHEVSSCGFWPGGPTLPEPIYYAYAYPTPSGYGKANVMPAAAYFHETLGEFVLPYEAVRQSVDPDKMLLDFLESTYCAAADLGNWPRQALDAES